MNIEQVDQADVYDHIDHVLNSMDMFALISENLINYTFNVGNYVSFLNPHEH